MIEQKIFKAALNSAGRRAASEHRVMGFFKVRLKEGGRNVNVFSPQRFYGYSLTAIGKVSTGWVTLQSTHTHKHTPA